jgi:hypothetical protein
MTLHSPVTLTSTFLITLVNDEDEEAVHDDAGGDALIATAFS